MFKSLEFFVGQKINIDEIIQALVAFGYTRATKVFKEGEFALRGGVLDIYPANFEIPLRFDLDDDTVLAIRGFDPVTAQNIDDHTIVLVLPFKTSPKSVFSSDVPLDNFVDIQQGDYVVHNLQFCLFVEEFFFLCASRRISPIRYIKGSHNRGP